jgi:hypothetical protein
MARKVFRPTTGQACWLVAIGAVAIGAALYLRYHVIEVSTVGLDCDAGLQSWQCDARKFATMMFNNSLFGYVALIAAALNLVRPSIVLLMLGLVAGGAGVVLYNGALSTLALALLVLSFARPAPEPD